MTDLVRRQIADLAAFVANLKERVRVAVAGELSRAVGEAVREVVAAVVAGRIGIPRATPRGRWDDDRSDGWRRPRDSWADDADASDADVEEWSHRTAGPSPGARVTAAIAAGAAIARWWAVRAGGGLLSATGVGLGVGLLGLLGGTLARTALAVVAATADILAATDALGAGAARLDQL